MANHSSALKRVRSNQQKRLRNRYQLRTCRTYIKKIKKLDSAENAVTMANRVASMIDKLAQRNVIHKNKAARDKSLVFKLVNHLSERTKTETP